MKGQTQDSEDGPVLDLQPTDWWNRVGWIAQRTAERLIPGCSGAGEPAIVPIAGPDSRTTNAQHPK